MIFKKLIVAINANTDALNRHTRTLGYTISPRMVHDAFASYLNGADDDLVERVAIVKKINRELGVKEIAELPQSKFHLALEMLYEATT